jgi:selenocysteine-specific elongation factor
VDRVFTIAGAGTVVTGTLAGGSFKKGEEVEISPEGRRARVRGIQSHKKELEKLGPGNRAALNLAGLERQGAERGDAIVSAGQWQPTARLHACWIPRSQVATMSSPKRALISCTSVRPKLRSGSG